MTSDSTPLERALELFLAWKGDPASNSLGDLVAAHPDLGDYLRALAEDEEPEPDSDERTVGEFRIVRELGRGGMGVVYEARQLSLGRRVALKVLAPHMANALTTIARFQREATTVAQLQHPGIVGVHDFGVDGDTHFLAMDLVHGASLDRVIAELSARPRSELGGGAMLEAVRHNLVAERSDDAASDAETRSGWSWQRGYVEVVLDLVAQVADALECAHAGGVIHRDVKPSNILVREDGRVVLTDFGLARRADEPAITATGDFAGTPYYVSPEQVRADPAAIDHRTDVFSLGTTLYELLTFERPFVGDTSHGITQKILHEEARDPAQLAPRLAPDLVAIVLKALEKRPADRYQSAAEFAADLRAFLEHRPVAARRPGAFARVVRWSRREPLKAGLGVVLVVSLALVGYIGASQGATEAGYEALREKRISDLLAQVSMASITGRSDEAALPELLELDPGNAHAIVMGTWITFRNEGPEVALDWLAANRSEGRGDAALDRLRHRLQHGIEPDESHLEAIRAKPTDAVDSFVTGLILRPGPHYHEDLADQAELAMQHFQDAISRSETANILHYMELAFVASRRDDERVSRRCADSVRALWPDSACAHMAAGIAMTWVDAEVAVRDLREAVRLDPRLPFAWRNLSVAQSENGDLEAAIASMRRATELLPEDPSAHSLLSTQLTKRGDHAEALAAAERSVEIEGGSPLYRAQYAACLERVGDDDGAWREIQKTVEIAPRYESSHRSVLKFAELHGWVDEMRKEAFRWVRAHPGGPTAHRELSEFLLEHGKSDRDKQIVLQAARNSVKLSSGADPYCWVAVAAAELHHGNVEEARRALEEARTRVPRDEGEEREDVLARIRAVADSLTN